MEMFSAPVIRSNLYVRPEVVIAGKKYMNTGSRFLCSFNPQPWSLEATEAWRRWCSTTAAIVGFMGSSRWFPREGSRGLVALWGTTGASGPPPLSGPGLWPQPQCPTGTAWSGGTSVGGGENGSDISPPLTALWGAAKTRAPLTLTRLCGTACSPALTTKHLHHICVTSCPNANGM